ncbi:MAG: GNAT family N-acetyltransferase [Rhodobacteraceae bacterium]|nr:GNAT family N-acetyltransferase [Paracoccaceae bacterium]
MNVDELAKIHGASFTFAPRPWTADEFESLLASANTKLFEQAGGFAIFRFVGPEAELLTIAVDPAFRRQGIAKTLMLKGHESARAANVEEVFLEVSQQNPHAKSLYEQFGYEVRAIRDNYYFGPNGQKINGLVMRCAL